MKNVVLLCFITLKLIGQNDELNHRKYWYYKSRLLNDFMKVGINQGDNIIFNERGYLSQSFSSNVDKMKAGDVTTHLGYYLAVLSTEYALLKANNQNTDSVVYQIYCTLYTINRLDLAAEKVLNKCNQGSLNGFFVRDDVYQNYIKDNYDHFNYYSKGIQNNSASRGFMSKYTFGMRTVDSDWFDHYEEQGNAWDNDMHLFNSQDQIYALLYGLAFVRKFIPPNIIAKDVAGNMLSFQDGFLSLYDEALSIADRIIQYARHAWSCENGNTCQGIQYNWHITIPNCVLPPDSAHIGADFGLGTYTYPMAEAGCMIKYNLWSYPNGGPLGAGNHPTRCWEYHTSYSSYNGYINWNTFIGNILPDYTTPSGGENPPESRIFGGLLNAVCYCSYNAIPYIFGYWYDNSTRMRVDMLARAGAQQYYYDLPYSLAVLHNLKVKDDFRPNGESISSLINVMNKCAHYDFGSGDWSSFEWSTSSRLEHQERIGDVRDDQFYGEYSALDFLLYHNLWYLYKKQHPSSGVNTYITDLGDVLIDKNNSVFNNNVNAYETCTIKNTNYLLSTHHGQFYYIKAGKAIVFKPGTYIYSGKTIKPISDGTVVVTINSGLRAYINGYTCADDDGSYFPSVDPSNAYRIVSGDTSTTTTDTEHEISRDSSVFHYPDTHNPYHYVEYPDEEVSISEPLIQENDTYEDPPIPVSNSYLASFLVYPNPFESEINIHFHKTTSNAIVRIFDIMGKLIFETKMDNSEGTDKKLALPEDQSYSSGAYFIEVEYNDGLKDKAKLMKY